MSEIRSGIWGGGGEAIEIHPWTIPLGVNDGDWEIPHPLLPSGKNQSYLINGIRFNEQILDAFIEIWIDERCYGHWSLIGYQISCKPSLMVANHHTIAKVHYGGMGAHEINKRYNFRIELDVEFPRWLSR